jgi:hypothetical protein
MHGFLRSKGIMAAERRVGSTLRLVHQTYNRERVQVIETDCAFQCCVFCIAFQARKAETEQFEAICVKVKHKMHRLLLNVCRLPDVSIISCILYYAY